MFNKTVYITEVWIYTFINVQPLNFTAEHVFISYTNHAD